MNKPIYVILAFLVVLLLAVIFMPLTVTIQAMQKATATPVPLKCNQVLPFVQKAGTACSGVDRDQICYGSRTIDVEYAEGNNPDNLSFLKPGDKAPLTAFDSISASRLNLAERELGIAIFKLQARVPGATAGQAVTFVVFGDAALSQASAEESTPQADDKIATFPNSGAFYFTTSIGTEASCKDVAANGLVVQSPRGTKVNFSMNGAKITIGSTILFQNQENQQLALYVIEGTAEVEAEGVTQIAKGGQFLTMPLEPDGEATEEADATKEAGEGTGIAGAPSAPKAIPQGAQYQNCALTRALGIRSACIILGTTPPTRPPKPTQAPVKPTESVAATVTTDPNAGGPPACEVYYFTAKPNPIPPDPKGNYCTTISWNTGGTESIYLNGQGVPGPGSLGVCLKRGETARYTLSLNCYSGEKKGATISVTTQ